MADRVCPKCEAPVDPANIKDLPNGAVEFDCAKCGTRLADNAERTELKLKQ